jgi:hypothetical protein
MVMPSVIVTIWLLLTPAQQVRALNAAHVYVEADAAAVSASAVLPRNIQLSGTYQSIVQEMLRRSVTFRRQCSRIGLYQWLRVTVEPALRPIRQTVGATTTITREALGGLEADVRLTGQGELVELIAHEFEHILEQLDGVDLAAMASRSGTGVHAVPEVGHFETDRAHIAGRRVASEVANARR